MFAFALTVLLAASPGERGVATARALVDDFQFAKALAIIGEALKEPGLSTATLISLYELEGITNATSGAGPAAKESFARLLTLDPAHAMPGELPPKARTLFYGARTVAQRETLELTADVPTRVAGLIESVSVSVKSSALLPSSGVRFTVSVGDAPATTTVVPLDEAHRPSARVNGAHVKWSAQLLGPHDAVLRSVERDELPLLSEPIVALTPPPRPPAVQAASSNWVRPAGVAIGVGGLMGAGIGIVLGVQSADARAKIVGAETDSNGVVIGLTQAQAAKLEVSATSGAVVANTLMVAGGVLTGTGLLMVLLGSNEPSAVKVSIGAGGLIGLVRF